jgi:TetR/AcrR family acrAB operon transcriptional repressor
MARKTKEEAAATRQALLDAALVVFSQKGYAATRLEDVAAQANVTRGAIYWHFKNKADLYNTLTLEVSTGIQGLVRSVLAGGGTFLEVCRRLMIRLLEYLEEDEKYRAVQELMAFKTEVSPELEEGMQMKRAAIHAAEERIAAAFRQYGISSGEVRADLDPAVAARAMLTYVSGISSLWLLDQHAFSLRESAPALVDVFIHGIAANSAAPKGAAPALDLDVDRDAS